MTLNTRISKKNDLASVPLDRDAYRQLIQQFYESSIQQYGADSEQTRMFKLHLTAHSAEN